MKLTHAILSLSLSLCWANKSVFTSDQSYEICQHGICAQDVETKFNINVYVPDAKFLPNVQSIVNSFADGLYESTNQAHRLARVTYVMDIRDTANADVMIDTTHFPSKRSNANANGYGKYGNITLFIYEGEHTSSVYPNVEEVYQGAVLAHEWGHYAYGLGDEYYQSDKDAGQSSGLILLPDDTLQKYKSEPSLMMGFWSNVPSTINFSTEWTLHKNRHGVPIPDEITMVAPYDSAGITITAGPPIVFSRGYLIPNMGLSAWQFLARDTSKFRTTGINYFPTLKWGQPTLLNQGKIWVLDGSVQGQIFKDTLISGLRLDLGTPPIGYIGPRYFLQHVRIDTLLPQMNAYVLDARTQLQSKWRYRNDAMLFYAVHKNLENHRIIGSSNKSPCFISAYKLDGGSAPHLSTLQSLSNCQDFASNLDSPALFSRAGLDSVPAYSLVEALESVLQDMKTKEQSLASSVLNATGKIAVAPKKITVFCDGSIEPGNVNYLRKLLDENSAELEVVQIGFVERSLGLPKVAVRYRYLPLDDFSNMGWLIGLDNQPAMLSVYQNNSGSKVDAAIRILPNEKKKIYPFTFIQNYTTQGVRLIFSDNVPGIGIHAFRADTEVSLTMDTLQTVSGKVFSLIVRNDGISMFDSLIVNNASTENYSYSAVFTKSNDVSGASGLTLGYGVFMSPVVQASEPVAIRFEPVPGFYLPDLLVKAVVMDSMGYPLDTIALQDSNRTGTYSGWYLDYPNAGNYWVKTFLEGASQQALWPLQDGFAVQGGAISYMSLDSLQERSRMEQFYVEGTVEHKAATCGSGEPVLSQQHNQINGQTQSSGSENCFVVKDTSSTIPLYLHLANVVGSAPTMLLQDSAGNVLGNELLHRVQSAAGYWTWEIPPLFLQAGVQAKVKAPANWQKTGSYTLVLDSGSSSDAPMLQALLESRVFSQPAANYTGFGIRITNLSGSPLRNFKVRYYFATEHFLQPEVADWWSAFCTATRIQLGPELWAVELDYRGSELAPGASFAMSPDNAIGVHYPDWSSWKTDNDWSYLAGGDFQENPRLVLLDSAGMVLQGQPPPANQFLARVPVHQVQLKVHDDQFYASNWSGPRIQLTNLGDSLADFQIHYYFKESSPIAEPSKWQGSHCQIRIDTLGAGEYRMVYDYAGFVLLPDNRNAGDAEAYVGLRRLDWGPWDRTDDPSSPQTADWVDGTRIEVYDKQGTRIWGNVNLGATP